MPERRMSTRVEGRMARRTLRPAGVAFWAVPLAASLLCPRATVGSATASKGARAPLPATGSRTLCGELLGYGGVAAADRPFYRPAFGLDVAGQAAQTPGDATFRARYVDLAAANDPCGVRRVWFADGVRFSFRGAPSDAASVLQPWGMAFRPHWVRLQLNDRGDAARAEAEARCWIGVLTDVRDGSLVVRGFSFEQGRNHAAGWFEMLDPETYEKWGLLSIPTGPGTRYTVNLDPVGRGQISAETGRVVEIIPDCDGRARYVDVLKVNRVFNFCGGNSPLSHDARGRYAFIEENGAGARREGRKLVWTAPDVRVYDQCRFPTRLGGFHAGWMGAWVDPRSGLVTHVFLADEEGEGLAR